MATPIASLALTTEPVSLTIGSGKDAPTATLTPFVSAKGNGCAVLAPKDVLPADVGRFFRGMGLPALTKELPTKATLTIGTGKGATKTALTLNSGQTSSGNPRRRADATVEHDGDSFRVAVQFSLTSKGWWAIATVIPGGKGGGAPMVSDAANPFS